MKDGFMDKLIERLDRLDPNSLQTQFLHLAGEKGLLDTILQAMQEGIIVIDAEGRIRFVNAAVEALLGLRRDQAMGRYLHDYLDEIEWQRLLRLDPEEWSRVICREIEVSYPQHRYLDFYIVPLSAVQHKQEGAVIIFRDVSRERESEQAQIESERLRAITLLAAGVAHEIGNPLNSLHIHLQLLARETERLEGRQAERMTELVTVARDEIQRLDLIINQFLRALRPAPPQRVSSHADALLRETLELMHPEMENRGVWVEIRDQDDLPTALLDKDQIKQVFFNLIKNAIQAMPDGGMLRIEFQPTDRFVAISFSDTGAGIDADSIGRIFEPYHTTKSDGSGLGLMIVQRVLRDHGGQFEVHSEPGEGTTVTILLPREDREVRLLEAPADRNKGQS